MTAQELTPDALPCAARLMSRIKPERWNYEDAPAQLGNINRSIKTIGRYLENGFRVIGIQPNAYERGFHLIMPAK